jgi:UPF0176 protein
MQITNIAGYKFIALKDLSDLSAQLMQQCTLLACKGTILLSAEGININIAAEPAGIEGFKAYLGQDERFAAMTFRESHSRTHPFRFLRVKIKKEIITMKRPEVKPEVARASAITPDELKQWLDEKRDITLLDTRNEYEVRFGTFANAEHFELKDFSEFPASAAQLQQTKPVVMFCTGGIRCEKAALHLLNVGFPEVYQLEGGILNYFAKTGGEHFTGECFVFDNRVAVNSQLQQTGTRQCLQCQGPIPETTENCETCK